MCFLFWRRKEKRACKGISEYYSVISFGLIAFIEQRSGDSWTWSSLRQLKSIVLRKDRLIAQAQSKTVQEVPQKENGLWVGIVCVLMHAPRRSGSGEGNCVQSSFTSHLIGLVFLDLGSRHTDQPLISCSWQLPWCLLFIGQHRMDHVTRHIFTCCLGMWEDTQEDTDW